MNLEPKRINDDANNGYIGIGTESPLSTLHISGTDGLIIDGFQSTLLFKINEKDCSKLSKIKIKTEKFFKNNKDPIKVKLFVNENILENFNIINFEEEIDINFKCQTNKYLALNFFIDNPLSLYDLKLGLNQSKRSIIFTGCSMGAHSSIGHELDYLSKEKAQSDSGKPI